MKRELELALKVALSYEDVLAVVHVGSSAVGLVTPNSDIDLIVIVKQPPRVGQLTVFAGEKNVDIQFIDITWFGALKESRFLDLQCLREAGRLATGVVLFNRLPFMEDCLKGAAASVLSPIDACLLLSHALNLRGAKFDSSEFIWELFSGVLSLSILAATFSSSKYQKPKWIASNLKKGGFAPLLDLILSIVCGSPIHEEVAEQFVIGVRERALEACRACGFPPLARFSGTPPVGYISLRDAMRDAEMLLELGKLPDACVCATFAIKYASALFLETFTEQKRIISVKQSWLAETLRDSRIVRQCLLTEILIERLLEQANIVQAHYQKLLAHRNSPSHIDQQIGSALLGIFEVHSGIWMGGGLSDYKVLRTFGIETVVLAAAELQSTNFEETDIHVIRAPLTDDQISEEQFLTARNVAFQIAKRLEGGGGGVFIGCNHGMNRSALIVVLTLQRMLDIHVNDAIELVRTARRGALNNVSFVDALVSAESS